MMNCNVTRMKKVFRVDQALPFVDESAVSKVGDSDLTNAGKIGVGGLHVKRDKVVHGALLEKSCLTDPASLPQEWLPAGRRGRCCSPRARSAWPAVAGVPMFDHYA